MADHETTVEPERVDEIRRGTGHLASEPHRPPRARRTRWPIFLLLAVVVIAAVLIARKPKGSAPAAPPLAIPTIKTATAHLGDMGYYVEALGTVTPLATVTLYSQVNGRVMAVHYVEGQMVHRGDPLIDIDPRPYEAQLKEAQGTLAHDKGLLAQAEMDLTRYEKASSLQAIARQTYDDQKMAVEQYKGTVTNDAGQVEYAQVQLSYCHLVSPINGRVGLRLVDPGNTIFSGSNSALVVVTQLQPITVIFNVSEDDLGQVREEILHRKGLPVDAYDRSQLVKLATGKLLTLDNQVDTSTGTIRFRSQFENKGLTLFPNQFVNVRMLVKTLKNAVLIPSAGVQRNGAQAFVYVVTADTVHTRQITELTTEGDTSAVTGLNAGDVVSVTGFDKLQDGAKVNIESQSGPTSGGSARSSL